MCTTARAQPAWWEGDLPRSDGGEHTESLNSTHSGCRNELKRNGNPLRLCYCFSENALLRQSIWLSLPSRVGFFHVRCLINLVRPLVSPFFVPGGESRGVGWLVCLSFCWDLTVRMQRSASFPSSASLPQAFLGPAQSLPNWSLTGPGRAEGAALVPRPILGNHPDQGVRQQLLGHKAMPVGGR